MWLIFILFLSLIIGLFAKAVYNPGNAQGCLPTILIGFAGLYIGNFITYTLIGHGGFLVRFFFSVLGGAAACWVYRKFETKQFKTRVTSSQLPRP